ncbi:hypothetical protein Tco_1420568 [Tanacetum coccineum]
MLQEKSRKAERSLIPLYLNPVIRQINVNSSRELLPSLDVTILIAIITGHSSPPINTEATNNHHISSLKSLHSSPSVKRARLEARDEQTDDALLILERHIADFNQEILCVACIPSLSRIKNRKVVRSRLSKPEKEQVEENKIQLTPSVNC